MTRGRACFEAFGAVNAKCQEGTEIDKTALLDEIYRSAYYRTRPEPARVYVDAHLLKPADCSCCRTST